MWAYKAAEALLDFYPVQALSLELAEYFHGGAKTAAKSGLALKIEGIISRAERAGASSVSISVPDWRYSY